MIVRTLVRPLPSLFIVPAQSTLVSLNCIMDIQSFRLGLLTWLGGTEIQSVGAKVIMNSDFQGPQYQIIDLGTNGKGSSCNWKNRQVFISLITDRNDPGAIPKVEDSAVGGMQGQVLSRISDLAETMESDADINCEAAFRSCSKVALSTHSATVQP